jgi:hypothetical protein
MHEINIRNTTHPPGGVVFLGMKETTLAEPILEAMTVLAEYKGFFGDYADVNMPDNDPRKLPKAIRLHGRVYGLSGHNTDLGKASYATGRVIAQKV